MDIHKFGKAPSLTARLHKNNIWQTWGVSLACRKNEWFTWLQSGGRASFLFRQSSSGESMKTYKAKMCRQLVKETCLQGLGFRFCGFPSLRTTSWISRRTFSEEHVPLWSQIWFTNDVRNQCSKLHCLERGYRQFGKVPSLTSCF